MTEPSTTRYVIKDLDSGKYLKEKSDWTEELLEAKTYRTEAGAKIKRTQEVSSYEYWMRLRKGSFFEPPHSANLALVPVSYVIKELPS